MIKIGFSLYFSAI